MDQFEPFLLTYEGKSGAKVRVVCLNLDEADAAFHALFTTMGETHPYSVDDLPADLHLNMRSQHDHQRP